jgi:hypothetical protein
MLTPFLEGRKPEYLRLEVSRDFEHGESWNKKSKLTLLRLQAAEKEGFQ